MSGLKFMAEQKFNREMTDMPERNGDPIDHSDSIHFVRGQLAAAREEVERQTNLRISELVRLKGLIRDAEWAAAYSRKGLRFACPWCQREGMHDDACPAFYPDGTVK